MPPNFDTSVPNIARIYDAMLGGKDNFAADRDAADRLTEVEPLAPLYARQHREFIGRAVRLVAGYGIRQFLDVGTGLPTMDNVHQIAHRQAPGSHVVYVDNDPNVCAHARALLADDPGTVAVVEEDLRRPEEILAHPETRRLIDFDEPLCVLVTAVLHFVPDADDPHRSIRVLTEAMCPGSHLVISHITDEEVRRTRPDDNRTGMDVFAKSNAPMHPRNVPDIERFLDGLDRHEPGLACISEWAAPNLSVIRDDLRDTWLGAVARKP
ncbi:SAM-dependent methyltransferase [Actinomadura sp. 7K507]|uniref:SAM-dependent methyltransferase n=1 Tax=Actinomadura sp. 7K507 TaxID=2530365 RepID=UPI00104829B9|nr:SAM-dependent methyltransferase [Actinomadura sp. 7K507]TDC81291.1 SAM-dependent methyltransferase [Actinomadura sp. 7K507]